MEDSRLQTILRGTLTLSVTSAFATGIYATFRKLPHPGFLVLSATFNSSITGISFFGCREYLISPALSRLSTLEQPSLRGRDLGPNTTGADSLHEALNKSKSNKLLDSALSGATVVGAFHAISRKPNAVRAMMTAGTVCTLLQYGYNELNVRRLRYISKLREEKRTAIALPSSELQSKEASVPFLQSLLSSIGIQPMSEEMYLEKMRKTRDAHLRRIAELEKKVIEEEEAVRRRSKS